MCNLDVRPHAVGKLSTWRRGGSESGAERSETACACAARRASAAADGNAGRRERCEQTTRSGKPVEFRLRNAVTRSALVILFAFLPSRFIFVAFRLRQ